MTMQDSGSRLALTVAKYKQLVMATSLYRKWPAGLTWIATDPFFVSTPGGKAPSMEHFDVIVPPDDVAFMQYTSGSTGNPKGIMISNANMFQQAQMIQRAVSGIKGEAQVGRLRYVGWAPQVRALLSARARFMRCTGLTPGTCAMKYHDMGLFSILASLHNGIESFSFSPLEWLQV